MLPVAKHAQCKVQISVNKLCCEDASFRPLERHYLVCESTSLLLGRNLIYTSLVFVKELTDPRSEGARIFYYQRKYAHAASSF